MPPVFPVKEVSQVLRLKKTCDAVTTGLRMVISKKIMVFVTIYDI